MIARLDLQRILAEKLGRDDIVQISLDCRCAHEGFTEPNQPFIRVNAHPNQVAKFAQADRIDGC